MRHTFHIFLTLLIAALALSVSGCDDAEQKARLTKAEREALRKADSAALKIGVMPTADCLPILVAKQLRLFDTLGVDVRLRKYHALSECRKALTDNLVEGAAIDSTLMKVLQDKAVKIEGAMATDLTWKFLTAKKARITRLGQLRDKFVAADSHGESLVLAQNATDSLNRKKPSTFIVQVEDPAVRLNMLTTGNVDAALMPEPYATTAQNRGAHWIKEVKSPSRGVLAVRTAAMKDKTRQQQLKLFKKAIAIAEDSIKKYGQKTYSNLLGY